MRSAPEPAPGSGSAIACRTCQRTIPDAYYEAGGQKLCGVCKDGALASLQQGSRIGRLLAALGLGAVAAAISAAGWYAIMATTGYELGLVAIVVGLFVGAAVRTGSRGRGGWLYQTMAVGLTYLAIATSYVPYAIQGFQQAAEEGAFAEGQLAEDEAAVGDDALPGELVAAPVEEAAAAAGDGAEEALALTHEQEQAAILFTAVVLAFAWPVVQVTQGGFVGTLIVGFALFEAWKLNRRGTALAGPFPVRQGSDAPVG